MEKQNIICRVTNSTHNWGRTPSTSVCPSQGTVKIFRCNNCLALLVIQVSADETKSSRTLLPDPT